jgi:glutamate racemase
MFRAESPAPDEPALVPANPGRLGTHRFVSSGDVERFRDLGARLLGPELAAAERAPWSP